MSHRKQHVVQEARDVDRAKALCIEQALETRFPASETGFLFKLIPLSVGAWLLVMRAQGSGESDTLHCGWADVQVADVLAVADELVRRWRLKRANIPEGEQAS